MLKKILSHSLLFLIFIFSSGFHNPDDFVQVLNQLKDKSLVQKLFEFHIKGIEKEVNLDQYDADEVINYCKSFLGTKHKMGGTTKKGIDCSGLVMVAHKKYNVILPHSSYEQARYGEIIAGTEYLQKGDLVFFAQSYKTSRPITHSGIYIGENKFIHTSASSGVIITSMDDKYWKEKYLFATRLKKAE